MLVLLLAACGPSSNPAREAIDRARADESVHGWTCPMHSEVHADEPGTCPVCSMPLVEAGG